MEHSSAWPEIIRTVLTLPASAAYPMLEVAETLVEDQKHSRFLVIRTGWFKGQDFYAVIQDLEIRDGYLWIHRNNTEHGLLEELTEAGIAADKIVLATVAPELRQRLAS